MRISSVSCLLMLGACSGGGGGLEQEQADDGAQRIDCALGQGDAFAADCLVEREENEGGTQLVVRHPDGGFRRFDQFTDGRGVAAADGADTAVLNLDGGLLEVSVGDDRYRFPARPVEADEASE